MLLADSSRTLSETAAILGLDPNLLGRVYVILCTLASTKKLDLKELDQQVLLGDYGTAEFTLSLVLSSSSALKSFSFHRKLYFSSLNLQKVGADVC